MSEIGDVLQDVEIGPIAHGGHWVARHDGRVIFVRHALTGERVSVQITGVAKRFAFGDAIAVASPSPFRVEPACPVAGVCGGCDFQHVEISHQRELKRQVIAEQLERLAGLSWTGTVEAVQPEAFGWRSRMRYRRDQAGWGLRRSRSHDVVALPDQGCLIAAPGLARVPEGIPGDEVLGVATAQGARWLAPGDDARVQVRAAGRTWQVRGDGFWQVHPAAADTLVEAVLSGLGPRAGETALDLYCGVGLFAGALVDAHVAVSGVEGARDAVELARLNVPQARFWSGDVGRALAGRDRRFRGIPSSVDLVVLDPPRVGAGAAVIGEVVRRRPRAIAYVACDPAALARDLSNAAEAGYRPASVRAFDVFPQTHHVECVAILVHE